MQVSSYALAILLAKSTAANSPTYFPTVWDDDDRAASSSLGFESDVTAWPTYSPTNGDELNTGNEVDDYSYGGKTDDYSNRTNIFDDDYSESDIYEDDYSSPVDDNEYTSASNTTFSNNYTVAAASSVEYSGAIVRGGVASSLCIVVFLLFGVL